MKQKKDKQKRKCENCFWFDKGFYGLKEEGYCLLPMRIHDPKDCRFAPTDIKKQKWSKEFIDHSPDFARCIREHGEHKADASCVCGIKEQHTHCKGCGRVVSIGPGTTITTYRLILR